ncbi:MAG: NAD(P)-dependent oxidoreductase [Bacteroidota bacterium]
MSQQKKKVLFVCTPHCVLQQTLEKAGFSCDMHSCMSITEVKHIIHNYCGIIVNSRFTLDRDFIDAATNLNFIGRIGAGMESIDVEYAKSRGIKCFNSPEGNRDAVGEHALGMLLMLLNRLNISDREVREGKWIREENRGHEIKNKTVAIIGYGNMGSAFAQRLRGFEAKVIAYDKYKNNFSNEFVTEVCMADVFEKADIVSLHVPLTEETKYLVSEAWLQSFRKNIYLINTARGKVVDTADLVNGLQSGKVKGAALDVIEFEGAGFETMDFTSLPESFQYLTSSENVVLSPHIAGWTEESKLKLSSVLAEKIILEFK